MQSKIENIISEHINSFIKSGFFPKSPDEGKLYLLPDAWLDIFNTVHFKYWAWIESYGEGSAIVFFDDMYDRIHLEYLVD